MVSGEGSGIQLCRFLIFAFSSTLYWSQNFSLLITILRAGINSITVALKGWIITKNALLVVKK